MQVAAVLVGVGLLVAPGLARGDVPPPAGGEAAVGRLGDASYDARSQATDALWQMGRAAEPLLREAAKSADPEVAARAEMLLWRLRLGIDPTVPPEIAALAVRARRGEPASARSEARAALAERAESAAPVVARLVADTLAAMGADGRPDASADGLGVPADDPQRALGELWPRGRWGVPLVASSLAAGGEADAARAWLRWGARQDMDAQAGPHYAAFLQTFGAGDDAADAPTDPRARAAVALSANPTDAAGALEAVKAADLVLPAVAWALLGGDAASAERYAAAVEDPAQRAGVNLMLATAGGDPEKLAAAERGAADVLAQLKPPAEPMPGEAVPEDDARAARRAAALALLLGRFDLAASFTEPMDATGVYFAAYRRFDGGAMDMLLLRHQGDDDLKRAKQIIDGATQARARNAGPPPELSAATRQRINGGRSLRQGDFADARQRLGDLAQRDAGDLGLRWQYAQALLKGGDVAAGEATAEAAVKAPLAEPYARRQVATEMWLAGDRDAALEQLKVAAQWGALVAPDALDAVWIYAQRLGEAERWDESRRANAAGGVLLLWDEAQTLLAADHSTMSRAMILYGELRRAEQNLAADKGDWAGATAAWRRGMRVLPAQSDASIELVTGLDAAGRGDEADLIYNEAMEPLLTALGRWKAASQLNNQAAWTSACCGRRLDSALRFAQAASRADPTSAAIADTLAEVLIRRGEAASAVDLMTRSLALADLPRYWTGREAEEQDSLAREETANYLIRRNDFLRRAGRETE